MASVNKAIVLGYLGADPVSKTVNGTAVAEFNVASTARWTDRNGQPQERTEWHAVAAWGRLAEVCQNYLHKGSQVYVEGRLQTDTWKDDACGKNHYRTRIVTQNMQMLDRRDTGVDQVLEQAGPEPIEGPPLPSEAKEPLPF